MHINEILHQLESIGHIQTGDFLKPKPLRQVSGSDTKLFMKFPLLGNSGEISEKRLLNFWQVEAETVRHTLKMKKRDV